jgi:autoinducer 2-degrading protein
VLVEVCRTLDDVAKHKETAHYMVWRDIVEHMMAEPQASIKLSNIVPDNAGWE